VALPMILAENAGASPICVKLNAGHTSSGCAISFAVGAFPVRTRAKDAVSLSIILTENPSASPVWIKLNAGHTTSSCTIGFAVNAFPVCTRAEDAVTVAGCSGIDTFNTGHCSTSRIAFEGGIRCWHGIHLRNRIWFSLGRLAM
jgi:hypothetical protein